MTRQNKWFSKQLLIAFVLFIYFIYLFYSFYDITFVNSKDAISYYNSASYFSFYNTHTNTYFFGSQYPWITLVALFRILCGDGLLVYSVLNKIGAVLTGLLIFISTYKLAYSYDKKFAPILPLLIISLFVSSNFWLGIPYFLPSTLSMAFLILAVNYFSKEFSKKNILLLLIFSVASIFLNLLILFVVIPLFIAYTIRNFSEIPKKFILWVIFLSFILVFILIVELLSKIDINSLYSTKTSLQFLKELKVFPLLLIFIPFLFSKIKQSLNQNIIISLVSLGSLILFLPYHTKRLVPLFILFCVIGIYLAIFILKKKKVILVLIMILVFLSIGLTENIKNLSKISVERIDPAEVEAFSSLEMLSSSKECLISDPITLLISKSVSKKEGANFDTEGENMMREIFTQETWSAKQRQILEDVNYDPNWKVQRCSSPVRYIIISNRTRLWANRGEMAYIPTNYSEEIGGEAKIKKEGYLVYNKNNIQIYRFDLVKG